MIEFNVNTYRLETAIFQFAMLTRREVDDVTMKAAGELVGKLITITPPGGRRGRSVGLRGQISNEAKKRGESAVAADIAKIFPTSKLPHDTLVAMAEKGFRFKTGARSYDHVRDVAESESDLKRVHNFSRNPKSGRTRKMGGIGMAITRKSVRAAYIKKQQKKVGKLESGWLNAAKKLGTSKNQTPAWITRHGAGPGGASVSKRTKTTSITIYNRQVWFPSQMEQRLDFALKQTEKSLKKQMEHIIAKNAAKANRRMKS